jgi:hypothetical protein
MYSVVDERIIPKIISKNAFFGSGYETVVGCCEYGSESSGFHKIRRISLKFE